MTQMPMLQLPPSPERTWRMLTIAADLLPVEVVETRRARKVRRSVVVGIIALVLALAGWYAYAVYQTSQAQAALDDAQSGVQGLSRKQAAFSPLVSAKAESAAIHTQLSGLLTEDLPWSSLVGPAVSLAPNGVTLTAIHTSLTQTDAAKTGAPKTQLPNTSKYSVIGQFTVSGKAPDKATVAKYVDALAGIKGLANPYVTSATAQDKGGFTFTAQFDLTKEVVGGRFTDTQK